MPTEECQGSAHKRRRMEGIYYYNMKMYFTPSLSPFPPYIRCIEIDRDINICANCTRTIRTFNCSHVMCIHQIIFNASASVFRLRAPMLSHPHTYALRTSHVLFTATMNNRESIFVNWIFHWRTAIDILYAYPSISTINKNNNKQNRAAAAAAAAAKKRKCGSLVLVKVLIAIWLIIKMSQNEHIWWILYEQGA